MKQGYKIPRNDFEVIEKFDSFENDNDLAMKMVEFYQEQRDRNVPLKDAYLKTLQTYSTSQNTANLVNLNTDNPIAFQYVS